MNSKDENTNQAVQPLVDELCSSWGSPVGDYKEVSKVTLEGDIVTNPATGEAKATVFVHAEGQTGQSATLHRHEAFDIGLGDLAFLAREAPRCREDFGRIHQAVAVKLGTDDAEYQRVQNWQAVTLKKCLRFKRSP